jgi:hypothetical protein
LLRLSVTPGRTFIRLKNRNPIRVLHPSSSFNAKGGRRKLAARKKDELKGLLLKLKNQ